ncbi:SHOCT domain-containing protein [Thiomonas sp. SCN 64-16]|uniref:SHOCT domain-containing protein n=1 Tax=Thiomonas sp. SCN 64-16 TaxID=1660151 RepID=UPI0033904440
MALWTVGRISLDVGFSADFSGRSVDLFVPRHRWTDVRRLRHAPTRDILDQRYARGAISADDYQRMKKDLEA